MYFVEFFFVFVLGTIIGSFLNVLIIRGNTGRSIGGRSACMSCGRMLTVLDLVPVVSYIVLRGKCRTCGSAISFQYPLVELSAGMLSVLAFYVATSGFLFAVLFLLCMTLLYIAVYDIRHTIIPDGAVVFVGVLATFFILHSLVISPFASLLLGHLASACIASAPLFLLWYFSSGRAMGFGDVKLAGVLGLFLYPLHSVAFLWLSFVLGGVVGVLLLSMPLLMHTFGLKHTNRLVTMKSEIPFGPFLISAFLLVLFFGIDVQHILEWFAL